jgi:PadR family transcriptional regulator PadR
MAREPESRVSQLRKGVVELAVLGLLSSRERYGSEIVDKLGAHKELAISAGTVYPLLSRLKKAGLIESTWRESPVGPPRKYYRLTRDGAAEFEAMTQAWRSVVAGIDSLLKGDRR